MPSNACFSFLFISILIILHAYNQIAILQIIFHIHGFFLKKSHNNHGISLIFFSYFRNRPNKNALQQPLFRDFQPYFLAIFSVDSIIFFKPLAHFNIYSYFCIWNYAQNFNVTHCDWLYYSNLCASGTLHRSATRHIVGNYFIHLQPPRA